MAAGRGGGVTISRSPGRFWGDGTLLSPAAGAAARSCVCEGDRAMRASPPWPRPDFALRDVRCFHWGGCGGGGVYMRPLYGLPSFL